MTGEEEKIPRGKKSPEKGSVEDLHRGSVRKVRQSIEAPSLYEKGAFLSEKAGVPEGELFAQLAFTLRGNPSPANAPGVVAPGGSYAFPTEHPGVPTRSIQASSPRGRFLCGASRRSPAI